MKVAAAFVTGGVALMAAVTACGSPANHAAVPTSTLPPPATTSTVASTTPATTSPSTPPSTGGGAGGSPGSTATVTSSVPRCATDGLAIGVSPPTDPGAGSVSYVISFSNRGSSPCVLSGFPGVSFVGATGARIGAAAARTGASPSAVSLASGQTASAVLRLAQAADFTPDRCRVVTAAGFGVIPPDETVSATVTSPVPACSGPIPQPQIQIGPIVAGSAAG